MNSAETFVAVLFADVAGSTRLYEQFGDVQAKRMVDDCMGVMRAVLQQYEGTVIKTIGDELMCVLPDAQKACLAAMDMQLKVAELPVVQGQQRAIRIGFHAGLVIAQDKDVFGDTVNLAARMTGLAKAGQIMTTEASVLQLPNLLRSSTRRIAALAVKGKEDDVAVCEVIWQPSDELTMATPSMLAPALPMQLELDYQGQRWVMDESRARVDLGRDAACRIVLADKKASRQHASIELRQEKFILTDQSTNGTFVVFEGESEVALRREQLMLQGNGHIAFGRAVQEAGDDVLHFRLVDVV